MYGKKDTGDWLKVKRRPNANDYLSKRASDREYYWKYYCNAFSLLASRRLLIAWMWFAIALTLGICYIAK